MRVARTRKAAVPRLVRSFRREENDRHRNDRHGDRRVERQREAERTRRCTTAVAASPSSVHEGSERGLLEAILQNRLKALRALRRFCEAAPIDIFRREEAVFRQPAYAPGSMSASGL
jgi:hypothetical protein